LVPTFANGWSGFTYRLQGNVVRLEGPASGGASGTTATTLSAGFRPVANRAFACAQSGGTAGSDITVTVSSLGVVQIFYPAGIAQAYVDGITYTVD
jgi:hypothetical protein